MIEYPVLDLRTQRPASGHYVYRFYGMAADLLYVGSTNNFWVRAGRHIVEHKDWWLEVSWDLTVIELVSADPCLHRRTCRLPGHAEMLQHERDLIKSLQPLHNSQLTGYCRKGLHLLAEHGRVQLNGTVGCYTCQLARQAAQYPAIRKAQIARRLAKAAEAGQLTLPDSP
jgi:hypothetical protein